MSPTKQIDQFLVEWQAETALCCLSGASQVQQFSTIHQIKKFLKITGRLCLM